MRSPPSPVIEPPTEFDSRYPDRSLSNLIFAFWSPVSAKTSPQRARAGSPRSGSSIRAPDTASCSGRCGSVRRKSRKRREAWVATPLPDSCSNGPRRQRVGCSKRPWFRFWQPPGANFPPIVVRFPDGTERSIVAYDIATVDEMGPILGLLFQGSGDLRLRCGASVGTAGLELHSARSGTRANGLSDHRQKDRRLFGKWRGATAKLIEDKANG